MLDVDVDVHSLILDALETYGRSVVVSAVASSTPDASPADFILIDQQGHAYSTYLVEAGQMKVCDTTGRSSNRSDYTWCRRCAEVFLENMDV
jgi:hypothetical protein